MSSNNIHKGTAVSLWFAKSTDKDRFSVSAWALDETNSGDDDDSDSKKRLLYTTLEDSPPGLPVVTAWLQKWQATAIHVGSATAPSKAVLLWLEGLEAHLQELQVETGVVDEEDSQVDTSSQAVPNARIVVHADLPKNAHKQTPQILQQLVQGNKSASYALSGNVDLTSNNGSALLQGLALLLQGLGLWQSSTSLLQDEYSGQFCVMPDATAAVPFLLLDRTAASSLNVWPIAHQGEAEHQGMKSPEKDSLWGILSKDCLTSMGKRLMKHWLRQPLTDLSQLNKRQAAVAFLVDSAVGRDSLRAQGLRPMQVDLTKLAMELEKFGNALADDEEGGEQQKQQGGIGSTRKALQALYNLYLVASQKVPALTNELEELLASAAPAPTDASQAEDQDESQQQPEILRDLCTGLQHVTAQIARSVELAEAVLDLDQAPREFMVKASYQQELADITAEMEQTLAEVDAHHQEMNEIWAQEAGLPAGNSNSSTPVVRLEQDTDGTWQFRLPDTNDSKILQNQLGSTVTVHRMLKNGVYFSTKQLRQLSTHYQKLGAEYDSTQRAVVLDAMKVAASYHTLLKQASDYVAQLDALASLAHVAAYSPHGYCRPVLTDGEDNGLGIELKGARHPCVELQEGVDFIPNDVDLVFGESSFKIVTGPNMGGKSTYIRALGAIVVLAQIGSYVPCTSAKINICHHILARVGAGDLQERGISTFMAEMLESSTILRTANKRSLIIIDELGRGTSTFDGYGLARAISEYICQEIGCMTVFATHFHELTALEEQEAVVQNCHVTAQKGSNGLTFLYEVNPGPCLESFGIQVAEMANVPTVVVQDAKRKALELENFEYRKKRQEGGDANTSTTDSTTASDESDNEPAATAEATEDVECMNKFCDLDFSSLFANCKTVAEKRAALVAALE